MPNKHILVADDNHDAADCLVELLSALGYEAHAAYDGQQALELERTTHPAMALLDVEMPKMDGCEAARRMREDDDAPAHIASISALSFDDEPMRSRGRVFDAHFRKPLDAEELANFVRHRLGPPDGSH